MAKDIIKLLKQRAEYQKKIKDIDSEIEKTDTVKFFNQMIKGKCFICKSHGHFLYESVWFIYKPQEIIVDGFTKTYFDIRCDKSYETYETEEGIGPGYARFDGWLRACHSFRFINGIFYAYNTMLKEVTEEEFWNELSKRTTIPVEELKKFSDNEKLCYSYNGRTD